jgi:DNA polymerase III subunit beta
MKFIINREVLLASLQQIVGVIEKRQTMPILANVLAVVSETQLVLTGTDLEIQLVAKIDIAAAETGSITIPARKFLDLCRLLPAEAEIQVEQQGEKIIVVSNRSRYVLNCLPAENYPEFIEVDMTKEFVIKSSQLKKALAKTVFCMANQDVRYYLNGLLLNISNDKVKFVASDGHRLAIFEDKIEQATGYEARLILPHKGVMELQRLVSDNEEELHLIFSTNNIKITISNIAFSAKLVDAKYPDFSKVFQQGFYEPIQIPKQELKNSLTRAIVLANEKFKGVTFELDAGNLKLTTHNPEHDEAEEYVGIDYQGDPLTIAFNAQYVLDAFSNIDAETAILTIASNASTCFIDEPVKSEYKFIVMPMRL